MKNPQIVLKNNLFCSWSKKVRQDEEKMLFSPTSVSIYDIFIKIFKFVNSGMDNVAEQNSIKPHQNVFFSWKWLQLSKKSSDKGELI